MANPFVHVELSTTDLSAAKVFYGKLFDWKMQDMPMPEGSYTLIDVGTGTGGGMMAQPIPGAPSAWLPYVEVADIRGATDQLLAVLRESSDQQVKRQALFWLGQSDDPKALAAIEEVLLR